MVNDGLNVGHSSRDGRGWGGIDRSIVNDRVDRANLKKRQIDARRQIFIDPTANVHVNRDRVAGQKIPGSAPGERPARKSKSQPRLAWVTCLENSWP